MHKHEFSGSVNSGSEFPSEQAYEEFLQESVECPTCRGLGRIKKDQEELVALIPVTDSRLKPRKTVLYVVIAVLISALTGGLILFFLISRTITMSSDIKIIKPTNITVVNNNVSQILNLAYQVPINVSNSNYFPITVTSLSLSSLLYGDKQINSTVNNTELIVPMRQNSTHYVAVNISLGQTKDYRSLVKECQADSPILWKLPMDFQVSATIQYLSNTETSAIVLYNREVCCHNTDNLQNPNADACL